MIPRLNIGDSELLAVPAVHDRSVFAEQVNQACRDEATRPEAVAVELSHDAVTATVAWLKELGVGPGGNGKLPCMLGLAKTNRRIHPRFGEAAIRLQARHGLPLHEIAPEILHQELNFSPVGLFCLSSTDSMIEAIRSAVELDLPVFGIDLGELANAERGNPLLQDTVLAQNDLSGYVRRNAPACVAQSDWLIDGRRELVMAARLKRLLQQYRRVLFTCGIGHWEELRRRLADPELRPALEPSRSEQERFMRLLVAPSLAVHQMDLLPELTRCYEATRQLPIDATERLMDYGAFCRAKLAAACDRVEAGKREGVAAFSQYLSNLCLVNQCRVPDLFMTLKAAKVMISTAFASRLGEVLVTEALDWAKPEDWPQLPYLRRVQVKAGVPSNPVTRQQVEWVNQGRRSAPFFMNHLSKGSHAGGRMHLPPLRDFKDDRRSDQHINSWVWPPCETLLFGTAYAAAEMVDRNARERCPEPFAGSMHEGVHIKATLRGIIRGEHRVQVKVASRTRGMTSSNEAGEEPTVFLFDREQSVQNGHWSLFTAGGREAIRLFLRNPARFDQVMREKGDSMVASVHFCTSPEPREALKSYVSDLKYLHGSVIFGSPSLNPRQSARWLEASDYARNPILQNSSPGCLFGTYQREHNMVLDPSAWGESLIRIALPYARRRVTVILSHPQSVPATLFREASARGISLEFLPLTQFPQERIEAIRHQYFVRPLDVSTLEYSQATQEAFGESPRKHLELLPERIRAQLDSEF